MSGWLNPGSSASPCAFSESRLVWCGIGGSLLPSETLVRALGSGAFQAAWIPLASPEPQSLKLGSSDQLVFASKSGKTLELWTWIGRLRSMQEWSRLEKAPIVISQDDDNPLARWARSEGFPILPIPVDVGGRYSAFTPVGTLPLSWMGLEPEHFLGGGRSVIQDLEDPASLWSRRITDMVGTLHQKYLEGVTEWVMVPYCLRMESFSAWWVQLVAESLGKASIDGKPHGITPIRAVGPIDQHSQLQRWMAGPRNLGVIVMTVDSPGSDVDRLTVPVECPYPQLNGLQGHQILKAQAEGTRDALDAAGIPIIHWALPSLDERLMGELMMAWQVIVGLTGIAMGVDPFDQPAVEQGKVRTFRRLGLI
jgi:glucose-6-phosphate isomerase